MDDPNITMKEYIRLEEEKAQKHRKVFNWETAKYGKIWYDEDIHDLRSVETEFPAIAFNDEVSSGKTLSYYTVIFDKNSFSYKIISTNDLKTDSENDNEKVNLPSFPSPEPTVNYFDDLDFFKDFENEFSAIVYNDALTSKSDFLTKPTVSPQHIDEFNLKYETSLSECDEEEQNVLYFNDLFSFNVIYPDDSKSDEDNDDDKINIEHSSGDLSIKPLPDVINTDDGAFAHGSNKLLETIGSTMRIPLLYRGEYSQWRERFMNYLEEQTDGEAMINSIQNGDHPLPVIAQVSLAGTAPNAPPTLKDPQFWTAEEKKNRKIDRLARSLLIQGLPNDIYSLIDSNDTAKDLWDALERQMRGSEYGEQDRKAAILYEYETFKATEGEQLLDTYLRYLQVINDLKKCGYKKDNCELNYKFLNNLQPEWKQYGTLMRQTKNLMDINIDDLKWGVVSVDVVDFRTWLGRYDVSVLALTKDHKGNKLNTLYPEKTNTPYWIYSGHVNVLKISKVGGALISKKL
ncbi:hypothetical protein Tco_0316899 [Tanacetum coccineum]